MIIIIPEHVWKKNYPTNYGSKPNFKLDSHIITYEYNMFLNIRAIIIITNILYNNSIDILYYSLLLFHLGIRVNDILCFSLERICQNEKTLHNQKPNMIIIYSHFTYYIYSIIYIYGVLVQKYPQKTKIRGNDRIWK